MLETLKALVNACGNDVEYIESKNGMIYIEINDFIGFDDDWGEIFRNFNNPKAVENLENWIEENPIENVHLSYSSSDI